MRSKFAIVVLAIAALLAGALVFVGLRRRRRGQRQHRNRGPGRVGGDQARDDGEAVDHAQRPDAAGGHGGGARAVHGRDRHQRRRRGRRLGRPARPDPQRRGLGRGPGRDPGGHHAGPVLRRARRLRGRLGPGRRHRRRERLRRRRLEDDRRSSARTARGRCRGSPRRASIYYRKDVLEKAGIDEATAFADWDSFRATLQTIKDEESRTSRRSARPARRRSTSSTT